MRWYKVLVNKHYTLVAICFYKIRYGCQKLILQRDRLVNLHIACRPQTPLLRRNFPGIESEIRLQRDISRHKNNNVVTCGWLISVKDGVKCSLGLLEVQWRPLKMLCCRFCMFNISRIIWTSSHEIQEKKNSKKAL